MVSIVIINHNGERWIGATIASCLKQSYSDLEVVIVDDCSTDRSWDLIISAAADDPRIIPVRATLNLGISGARNLGIDHASGEFIAILDSDDVLLPSTVDRCLSKFLEIRDSYPDLVLLTTDAWLINEMGLRVGRYMPRNWWNRTETLDPPLWTVPSSWFFPRAVPVRFCSAYRSADAPIFIHRMKAIGRVAFWGEANFEYRLRMSSVSNASGNPMVREMNAFRRSLELNRLDNPLHPNEVDAPTWSQAAAWTYGRSAKAAAANGRWLRAIRDFLIAAVADFPLTMKKIGMVIARRLPEAPRG